MATSKVPSYDLQEARAQKVPIRATIDQMPRLSQQLKLVCMRCGRKHKYDVGTIFLDPEGEGETAARRLAFTNYFHCLDCGSPGPWDTADSWRLLGLALRAGAGIGQEGVIAGRCELFDGTSLQTPAMGEEYLRGLLDQDPNNAFFCTRLGNLMRGCGERDRATGWYEKAIALDVGDIEARYHLYSFAVEDLDLPAATTHALLLVRSLLEGRETGNVKLTQGIALKLVDTLRDAPPEFRVEFRGVRSHRWSVGTFGAQMGAAAGVAQLRDLPSLQPSLSRRATSSPLEWSRDHELARSGPPPGRQIPGCHARGHRGPYGR